jgi:hypothetical protein
METRTCQNCKTDFQINQADFAFYDKLKVPAPTFCPDCRFQRRLMFRNERVFYWRECELCHQKVLSIFSPERGLHVLCNKCWWTDEWDPGATYLDYDPNRNFFDQLKELQEKTFWMQKVVDYATVKNSDYINHAGSIKDSYWIFTADYCENVYYGSTVVYAKDAAELIMGSHVELVYNTIGGSGSSSSYFNINCSECVGVWYSKNCTGCTDCFGCVNLRNKSNCIYNEQYTKEEYKKKIAEMELDKHSSHVKIKEQVHDFWKKFPNRYVHGRMNHNATGEYVVESKNAKECYQAYGVEDCAYTQMITLPTVKDTYDMTDWGNGVERCIDVSNTGEGSYEVKYSAMTWGNIRNQDYCMFALGCSDVFGCVNLRKKQYCILNKQYSKEEYEKLRAEIIESLNNNPYIDSKGRVWKYGDFMPYDISPFAYNESFATQYFPMSKEEIEANGFRWIEPTKPNYTETIQLADIPDSINDIPDTFVSEILKCTCGKYYRIVVGELQLLKRFGIPVPRECPDCRHMGRIKMLRGFRLYDRTCDKCGKAVKSSFKAGSEEVVYCEECYQREVV